MQHVNVGFTTERARNTEAAEHRRRRTRGSSSVGGPRAGDVVARGPVRVARARSETLKAGGPVRDAQAAPTSRRGTGEKYITNRWRRSKGRAARSPTQFFLRRPYVRWPFLLRISVKFGPRPGRWFHDCGQLPAASLARFVPPALRGGQASSDSPNLLAEGTLPSFEMHRRVVQWSRGEAAACYTMSDAALETDIKILRSISRSLLPRRPISEELSSPQKKRSRPAKLGVL
ncbi:hypothetical protein ISCGN_004893 [Ixodes scapularis]